MADEPDLGSDLLRRSATAVRKIPAERIQVFCASCAERFFDGYKAWTVREPAPALPSAAFVRRAIDACWEGATHAEADDLLRTLGQIMPREDEQPIFKSPLNDYFVEPWLLNLGLSCVLDPQVNFGLQASAAALDFHWQLLMRRVEMAGKGPTLDDPEFDRKFEIDSGAMAESAIQIEEAEQLRLGMPDRKAMRMRSADHGRKFLGEVLRLLAQ